MPGGCADDGAASRGPRTVKVNHTRKPLPIIIIVPWESCDCRRNKNKNISCNRLVLLIGLCVYPSNIHACNSERMKLRDCGRLLTTATTADKCAPRLRASSSTTTGISTSPSSQWLSIATNYGSLPQEPRRRPTDASDCFALRDHVFEPPTCEHMQTCNGYAELMLRTHAHGRAQT